MLAPLCGAFCTESRLAGIVTLAFVGLTQTPLYGSATQVAAAAGLVASSGAARAVTAATGRSRALANCAEDINETVHWLGNVRCLQQTGGGLPARVPARCGWVA